MQTRDYARAALWDTAIKFSLQSRAMTSPDHLEEVELFLKPAASNNPLIFLSLISRILFPILSNGVMVNLLGLISYK